ncbi:MAG: diguanylate cyclase, partial [Rhodobacteraceae bacterium]|nr:diguanylate cyclase [Paracoccaceae bacterium]
MNDETRLAFAHPLERAKASSISTQYDRISLR